MNSEKLLSILRAPHVSEKTSQQSGSCRQYAFEVLRNARKPEIKQAVENYFNVKVKSVRVCNVKSKLVHFRQKRGRQSGWKKAYITLVEGNEIDIANH